MKYSRGGTGAITAALVALALFGNDTSAANAQIAEVGGLSAYLASITPDELNEIIHVGELNGILGTRAQTGDILGYLRWVADSGSFDEKYFDHRGSGEMLKIQGRVSEATDAGVKGDMIFYTTQDVENAPSEVMRIASDGNVHITGSLFVGGQQTFHSTTISSSVIYSSGSNIFGDAATDTHTFTGHVLTGHITASGDISASKTITADRVDVTNTAGIYADKIRRYSDSGTTTKITLNDEVLKLHAGHSSNESLNIQLNEVTITPPITASGNISSSGYIIGTIDGGSF